MNDDYKEIPHAGIYRCGIPLWEVRAMRKLRRAFNALKRNRFRGVYRLEWQP